MYLEREEMAVALHTATRLVRPGGSFCFTHFVEPQGEPKVSSRLLVSSKQQVPSSKLLGTERAHRYLSITPLQGSIVQPITRAALRRLATAAGRLDTLTLTLTP